MNEDTLYSIIGRLWVESRVAQSQIERLQQQIAALQKPPEPPPADAPSQ